MAYLKSTGLTNKVTFPAGLPLQVLSTTKLDTFSVGGTGISAVTGLYVEITPSSTSNKILVQAHFCGTQGDYGGGFFIYRGGSLISSPTGNGERYISHTSQYEGTNNATRTYTIQILDAPSSVSAQTYQLYVAARSNTSYHVNRSTDDTNTADRPRTIATITAMEVQG